MLPESQINIYHSWHFVRLTTENNEKKKDWYFVDSKQFNKEAATVKCG